MISIAIKPRRSTQESWEELMAIVSRHIWQAEENKRKIMTDRARGDAPGHFLQLRDGQTHYQLDPGPDNPLLICIHGWSTANYVWDPLKPLLRAKGYRVLTYDLYGRGYSDRPDVDHSAKLFTDQLSELLERLSLSSKPLNVIGYSMGGAIAARFVNERMEDVERLLLIAPAGMAVRLPGLRAFARRNPNLADPHILALLPLVLRRQFRSAVEGFEGDPAVTCVLRKQLRELDYRGYLPSLVSSLHGVLASEMAEEHRQIAKSSVAVRAVFAEKDNTIPIGEARDLFDSWNPNKVSFKIPNAGHAVPYTHPQLIVNEVSDFLE